jgi:3-phenylpropionate/cinnamic acid dioxygenase small subunit
MTITSEAGLSETTPAASVVLRAEIEQALYAYAAAIDHQDFSGWADWFTDDGSYTMTTFENDRGKGLLLNCDRGKPALKERSAYVAGYFNFRRNKTMHVINNVRIVGGDDQEADVVSYLTLYKTGKQGDVRLQATGECRDRLVRTPQGWRFRNRQVVLDAELFPSDLTDLL